MSNPQITDANGKPLKRNTIPVVHYKDYSLPVRILSEVDAVKESSSVTPGDVIREMRAAYVEMVDRFTLLATGLSVVAKQNPGGEMDQYLSQIGLELTDMGGKKIYEPNEEYRPQHAKAPEAAPQAPAPSNNTNSAE